MSVTTMHDTRSSEVPSAASWRSRPHPRTPTVAIIVTDHAPDPVALAHLVEDYEVVLLAHDAEAAVSLLRGLPGQAVVADEHAEPAPVTPLFDSVGLVIDEPHQLASWCGRPLPLTGRERAILARLVDRSGQVLSYRELFESAWGTHYLGDPALVHSALKRLRRKLREAGADLTIDAVRGVGFRAT